MADARAPGQLIDWQMLAAAVQHLAVAHRIAVQQLQQQRAPAWQCEQCVRAQSMQPPRCNSCLSYCCTKCALTRQTGGPREECQREHVPLTRRCLHSPHARVALPRHAIQDEHMSKAGAFGQGRHLAALVCLGCASPSAFNSVLALSSVSSRQMSSRIASVNELTWRRWSVQAAHLHRL